MKVYLSTTLLAATLILSACKPYQMDIAQGKPLSPKEIAMVKVGMSKAAVLTDLGTPLQGIAPYDQNRLDYIYTLQKNGGAIEEKCLSIFFKNNAVVRLSTVDQVISP